MVDVDHPAPLFMVALDAAEPSLVEQWMGDGTLPNLRRLKTKGVYYRLASSADWLTGSPWPTFYTGTMPAKHGVYHYLQWRADRMAFCRPHADWLSLSPFWHDLGRTTRRVIVLDLPMTFPPTPFNGVEISGWATHDRLAPPASYPTEMLDWIRREFGVPPLSEEIGGLQSPKSLLRLRDQLISATYRVADLARSLMTLEKWDLFMVGFGATHRAGHKLWDLTGVKGEIEADDQAELAGSLRDVYIACDAAVGELIEAVGDGVNILVFSLHGMGANTNRSDLLPTMLDRILGKDGKNGMELQRRNYLQKLRKLIPLEWRHSVKKRLPTSLQDRLTLFWRKSKVDWSATPAFTLMADLQGYIRINLLGREAEGVVKPGKDYDRICEEIVDGLHTFVDADTSEPIVERIIRSDQLFASGSYRNNLPDLIVQWVSSPATRHQEIVSPRYGSIVWPTPGHNPDGRSGNHRAEGFLLAAGDHIQHKSQINHAHIVDLAPTIYALLGVPKPGNMEGQVISVST